MKTFAARALAALTLGLVALGAGAADQWPDRPIKIVIPFPPGGTTDQIARHAQKPLTDILGVPIVIENHGGGSGSIGAGMVAHSPPDGYTFLIVFDTHGVNPSIIPNMSFDTLKDLAPIMLIGTSPMAITAYPSTPYKTFKEVLEDAKGKEGGVSFGTIGAGSLAHLYMTQVSREMKVPLTHVPYRGGGPLVQDAIAGHVPVAIASAALLAPSIKAGKLRPLAVTSAQRFPQLPDVPTVAEQGIPAAESNSWVGDSRAGRDAAADHREDARRLCQGDAVAGGQQAPRRPGPRDAPFHARGVRHVPRERGAPLGEGGEGEPHHRRPMRRGRGPASGPRVHPLSRAGSHSASCGKKSTSSRPNTCSAMNCSIPA